MCIAERARGQDDVTGFYRHILDRTTEIRSAALQVSLEAKVGDHATSKQEEGEKARAMDEVAQARAAGLDVRVNADNVVVDKRDLLSAGLNTRRTGAHGSRNVLQRVVDARAREAMVAATAANTTRRTATERKRRAEAWQTQMEEREARQAAEAAAEQAALAEKLARRTTNDAVSDARARYLARKAAKQAANDDDEEEDEA
ncbi:hypothetical protein SYNPS1DRAFT_31692 [Syncephalis pseudoplumigaleata]|uniref:Uncharacterized protein n=1 Tax=Syncephalis pseudoplumigaleata TaxID=1712513 RepID=A0A4P9YSJ1_9FUNG|nr:hypothetical protein SYNPS1DRAFT_31692 [Syncephalis pseudoplumigaleata]|eukprot:RKP22685.1 hypothetical protein SYNPS1DRAFT_31692 [Syncephalis pseudoplumigaleata]